MCLIAGRYRVKVRENNLMIVFVLEMQNGISNEFDIPFCRLTKVFEHKRNSLISPSCAGNIQHDTMVLFGESSTLQNASFG